MVMKNYGWIDDDDVFASHPGERASDAPRIGRIGSSAPFASERTTTTTRARARRRRAPNRRHHGCGFDG